MCVAPEGVSGCWTQVEFFERESERECCGGAVGAPGGEGAREGEGGAGTPGERGRGGVRVFGGDEERGGGDERTGEEETVAVGDDACGDKGLADQVGFGFRRDEAAGGGVYAGRERGRGERRAEEGGEARAGEVLCEGAEGEWVGRRVEGGAEERGEGGEGGWLAEGGHGGRGQLVCGRERLLWWLLWWRAVGGNCCLVSGN